MAQTPKTFNVYTADGQTRQFAVTFPYRAPTEVFVTVDGEDADFDFATGSTVALDKAPNAGSVVRVERSTPAYQPDHQFQLDAPFLPEYVDANNEQILNALQETNNQLGQASEGLNSALETERLQRTAKDDAITDAYKSADASLQAQVQGEQGLTLMERPVIQWHKNRVENSVNIPAGVNAYSYGPGLEIDPGQEVTVGEGSTWSIQGVGTVAGESDIPGVTPQAVPSTLSVAQLRASDTGEVISVDALTGILGGGDTLMATQPDYNALSGLDPAHGQTVFVQGRWPRREDADANHVDPGAGMFWWDSTQSRSRHNGGTYVSPTVDPLLPDRSNNQSYLRGEGETQPDAKGVWRRVYDDSAAVLVDWFGDDQYALQAAMDVGRVVRLRETVTYVLDAPVTSFGKDITIELNGATVVRSENNEKGCFGLYGGWDNIRSIVTHIIDPSSTYPYVYVDGPVDWQKGDVIKLVNEKTYEFFKNVKEGEFAVLYNRTGGDEKLEFPSELVHSYKDTSQNPRAARLSNARCRIVGPGRVQDLPGYMDQSDRPSFPLIEFGSCRNPQIHDVRFDELYNDAVRFHSCFEHRASGLVWSNGHDTADGYYWEDSGFGSYGIRVVNSTGGEAWNCEGHTIRHMQVVIGMGQGNPTGGLSAYSPCRLNVMRDSHAYQCTNSPYDTHHGVEDTVYRACHSYNTRTSAWSARGLRTVFENCHSVRDGYGLQAFTQSGYTPNKEAFTRGTVAKNCVISNPRDYFFRYSEHANDVTMDGCYFHIDRDSTIREFGYYRNEVSAVFTNCTSNIKGALPNFNKAFSAGSGTPDIRVMSCSFYIQTSTNLNNAPVFGDKASMYIEDLTFQVMGTEMGSLLDTEPTSGSVIGKVNCSIKEPIKGRSDGSLISNNYWKGPIQPNRYTSWGKMAFNVR